MKSFLSGAAPAKDAHYKFRVKSCGFRVTFDQDVSVAPSSVLCTSPSMTDGVDHNNDFFILLFIVRLHLAKFLACCALSIDAAYNTVR